MLLAALLLLSIQSSAVPDAPVGVDESLRLVASTECPSREQLAEAFASTARRTVQPLGQPSANSIDVEVADASADTLEVALSQNGQLWFRRSLSRGESSCDALATTVALLVEAWLSLRSPVLALPLSPPVVERPAAAAVSKPPPSTPARIRVRLLGGLLPIAPLSASGDLELEATIWRGFGAGLRAGLLSDVYSADESLLARGVADAQVIVHRQRFGAFASWNALGWRLASACGRTQLLSLDLLATLDDLHGVAASPGYPGALSTSTDTALLGGAARVEVPLAAAIPRLISPRFWDRFFFVGEAGLSVALAEASYLVEANGPQVVLQSSSRLLLDLELGLGMRLL